MRRLILKIIYILVIFAVSTGIILQFFVLESSDQTAVMGGARLPLVRMDLADREGAALLHGFLNDRMDVGDMRGTVLPVTDDRLVRFMVMTYGEPLDSLKYEVRDTTGENLVEQGEVSDRSETDYGDIRAQFVLKDLMEPGEDYMLIIKAGVEYGTVSYYTRIFRTDEGSAMFAREALDFAETFHDMTFDPERSGDIKKYLESNRSGDNTSFANVNIHSSLKQVTWGELDIVSQEPGEIRLNDIRGDVATVTLESRVVVAGGSGGDESGTGTSGDRRLIYDVSESFRLRSGSDRIYLLDYDRTMQYRFSGQAEEFYSEGIELGIGQEKFPFMESPDGQVLAFTAGVRLFSFNKQNSEIAMLFSFEDNENSDVRCTYRNHDVDIVSVEDNGNVTFLVTGYMNRGTHEGRSGMALYRYDESIRLLEELAFIPTDLEPSLLRRSVARMSHVGVDNELYVMLSDDIVAISSGQSAVRTVIRDAARNAYFRSETGALFARAETETNTGIDLTDFSTGKTERIEADPGTRLIPLGFMREDLVYGVVNDNDIRRDQAGNDVYAMENVRIRDSKGNVLENYSSPGNYVISAECDGNQIRLTRVVFNEETGFYEESTPDQIINTLEAKEKTNRVITVTDDVFEKQVRIDLRKAVDTDRLKMPVPEFQITNEPANDVFNDSTSENTYYVYGTDGYVMGIYADEAVAVRTAAESGMVVVDRYNRYVWERRSMATKNQIMSLTSMAESAIRDEGESSAAFCLKLMLEHRGINRDVEEMLSEGASFTDIVRSGLEEYRPLTLGGCEMNSVLYYVNKDVPVLVSMSDGSAILLIGFNETELVIVDPSRTEGERVYKITRSSGVNLFQNNGNRFFTYYGV